VGATEDTENSTDWLGLLTSLTDEELARYGEIAADQKRLEWRHGWAQVLLAVAAVASITWAIRAVALNGLTWSPIAGLALGLTCAYWPYRQWVVRKLWRRHLVAVEREMARRRTAAR
jgi:hypothetical protein